MKDSVKLRFALLLAWAFCCSNNDNPVLPINGDFTYPMRVGDKWEYRVTETLSNFRPAIPGVKDSTSTFDVTVEIIGLDTLQGAIVVRMFEDRSPGNDRLISLYRNETDGMYLYFGLVADALPKSAAAPVKRFAGLNLPGVTLFEITGQESGRGSLSDAPLKVFPYPFEVGSQWLFQEVSDPTTNLGRLEKKIVGTEKVQVPAGEFASFRIQWLLFDKDGVPMDGFEMFDFVSESGLVQRTIFAKDVLLTSGIVGTPIYLVDKRTESQLRSVQLRPE